MSKKRTDEGESGRFDSENKCSPVLKKGKSTDEAVRSASTSVLTECVEQKKEQAEAKYVIVICSHEEGVNEDAIRAGYYIWKLPSLEPRDFPIHLRPLYDALEDGVLTLSTCGDENFSENAVGSGEWIRTALNHFCGEPVKTSRESGVIFGSLMTLIVYDNWVAAPVCTCH